MKTTLYVCEAPSDDGDGRLDRRSMRPFVEGLSEVYGARLYYRTFTTQKELQSLLTGELPDARYSRVIVYISAHGSKGRLYAGFQSNPINLSPVAKALSRGAEGVWLSACYTGGGDALSKFKTTWVGGYRSIVGWDTAMLIDTAVLGAALEARSGQNQNQKKLLNIFRGALRKFSPDWPVHDRKYSADDGRGGPTLLRSAIRLFTRSKRGGLENSTDELLRRLGWELEHPAG